MAMMLLLIIMINVVVIWSRLMMMIVIMGCGVLVVAVLIESVWKILLLNVLMQVRLEKVGKIVICFGF